MKTLLIMASLFPPQTLGGGPIVSIFNLVNSIRDSFDVYVISQNFELKSTKPLDGIVPYEWNDKYGISVYYVSPNERRFFDIYKLIRTVSPDVIYQNSFFSADQVLPVLYYTKKHKNVECIIAPRGELGEEKIKMGCLKKNAYIGALKTIGALNGVIWHATSKAEESDIKRIVGNVSMHSIANLPSVYSYPCFDVDKSVGELRLFSISRVQSIKNIALAIECLRSVRGKVLYDIYGPIEEEVYWEECKRVIDSLPDNIEVNYKGQIDHDDIEQTIMKYHALLSPTKGENFGQTIVDSFLNGRPVIISNMTPWSDCESFKAGFVVDLSNLNGFTEAVQAFSDMEYEEFCGWMNNAYSYIEKKINPTYIVSKYIDMFGGVY